MEPGDAATARVPDLACEVRKEFHRLARRTEMGAARGDATAVWQAVGDKKARCAPSEVPALPADRPSPTANSPIR